MPLRSCLLHAARRPTLKEAACAAITLPSHAQRRAAQVDEIHKQAAGGWVRPAVIGTAAASRR